MKYKLWHPADMLPPSLCKVYVEMSSVHSMGGALQAAQLIELAQLQVGVRASADPSVRIMAPKTDFSSNIRQRLFR